MKLDSIMLVVCFFLLVYLMHDSCNNPKQPNTTKNKIDSTQHIIDTIIIIHKEQVKRIETNNNFYNEKVNTILMLPDSIINDCLWSAVDRFDSKGYPKAIYHSNTSRAVLD